jgi:hypothetical protein
LTSVDKSVDKSGRGLERGSVSTVAAGGRGRGGRGRGGRGGRGRGGDALESTATTSASASYITATTAL